MASPPSASDLSSTAGPPDAGTTSNAFTRLHPRIQRWVWEQKWTELRDAQERAAEPLLAADRDLIISAATASGKTEAAFLSICTVLLNERKARDAAERRAAPSVPKQPTASGVQVLYVSPLKALINDQYGRLEALCENLDIPVHRWHGDVPGSRKSRVLKEPSGLLLITPESLEALFIRHGPQISRVFAGLRYVVVDELHAFFGTERGAQLQSLLNRVELAMRRRVPRVGLSATLGDMPSAAEFLRPGAGDRVTIIVSADGSQELRLQLKGYEAVASVKPPVHTQPADSSDPDADDAGTDDNAGDMLAVADDMFAALRGTDNLVFANARGVVETYADLLTRRCAAAHVPNEFFPHHGSLSKDLREEVEARLKNREVPATAVCTSTLELGIDIGSVSSISQIGAPYTVASLRQRLGRSGRRGGPATLRLYVTEKEISPQTPVPDALRDGLVQSVAMVNLLLEGWNESPDSGGLHLSTLIQQLLSLIAQHGGLTPLEAYQTLCSHGPFSHVTSQMFRMLLRALADDGADIVFQATDGLLLLGVAGERMVNHYTFYAAFRSAQEYRLVAYGRPLGMLPIDYPIMEGSLLIFGGRRWEVIEVDDRAKVVDLVRSKGGRPPSFGGASGAGVANPVREEMKRVYASTDVPIYLDATAARLLAEGRSNFLRYGLDYAPIVSSGQDTMLFGWTGDRIMSTLAIGLTSIGADVSHDGICLTLPATDPHTVRALLDALVEQGPPDPVELAATVPTKVVEKHDELLSDELLDMAFASRSLDVTGAWDLAGRLAIKGRDASPR